MEKLISCCGLDCSSCDARIATLANDDELRKATALKWEQLYQSSGIPFEAINCTGCRETGVKFSYCQECKIRKCADEKGYNTCGECDELLHCDIVGMVHQHMPEALLNLQAL